jgi:transketolase
MRKYRNEVLPANSLLVSIEAGIAQGWHRWIGSEGLTISLEHYGASASANTLFQNFGFSEKNICEKVRARLQ